MRTRAGAIGLIKARLKHVVEAKLRAQGSHHGSDLVAKFLRFSDARPRDDRQRAIAHRETAERERTQLRFSVTDCVTVIVSGGMQDLSSQSWNPILRLTFAAPGFPVTTASTGTRIVPSYTRVGVSLKVII